MYSLTGYVVHLYCFTTNHMLTLSHHTISIQRFSLALASFFNLFYFLAL